MFHLRTRPQIVAAHVNRARDSTPRFRVLAFGVAMIVMAPALAPGQTTTAGPQARPALSKEPVMTHLSTVHPPPAPRMSLRHVEEEIRPFHFRASDEALADLRSRMQAARFPEKELVADHWRRAEARLKALPQFSTEIDGVEIHFIHVKSQHENALPLIMTHGWPGSVVELLDAVGPLTDPTVHGGTSEDAFHLVLPSLPGSGFSGKPTALGWAGIRVGSHARGPN